MREETGDLWSFYQAGEWVVIPTNGSVRRDGACVMGRGLALDTKVRFPHLPELLGEYIKRYGNIPFCFIPERIITFPVKHRWYEMASLTLIGASTERLAELWIYQQNLWLPRVGCGNGRLDWRDVKPMLVAHLDDRFIVVE